MRPNREHVEPHQRRGRLAVPLRGAALKDHPFYNKGTCFSEVERDALDLGGLLPPHVATPEEQAARAYANLQRKPDPISR